MKSKRKIVSARRNAKKAASAFSEKVFRTATFERPKDEESGEYKPVDYPGQNEACYSYQLGILRLDEHGNLIGNAGCDDALVCTQEEIPHLIAFLQKLVS
jgi:hypothetical protein